MFRALIGQLIFGALPGATLACGIVWFFMRPKDGQSLRNPVKWFLIGLLISLFGSAFFRLNAIYIFGVTTAFDPPAEGGVAGLYILLLPGIIAYAYMAWLKREKYESLKQEFLATTIEGKSNQNSSNLSITDRMMKKGAVGQTAKSCANVFIKMKSPNDDLHTTLIAVLDFRYSVVPTKGNAARHRHIAQRMINQLSSEVQYGLKNLVMDVLSQEMDIVGIENDVQNVVVEVLRESQISDDEINGTSRVTKAAQEATCEDRGTSEQLDFTKDYYTIMGLDVDASASEIVARFKYIQSRYIEKLDKPVDTAIKELVLGFYEAYNTLGFQSSREKYDQWYKKQKHEHTDILNATDTEEVLKRHLNGVETRSLGAWRGM